MFKEPGIDSEKSILPAYVASLGLSYTGPSDWDSIPGLLNRARTLKFLWGPGIDAKEWIPQAYVVWRAGTKTLFLLGA
jgi:hypothetical protein